MPALDPKIVRAQADLTVRSALDHIEQAQRHLGEASALLSNLTGGAAIWLAAGKLYDRVHAFWYRVAQFRKAGRFSLDPLAQESLAKKLALKQTTPTTEHPTP